MLGRAFDTLDDGIQDEFYIFSGFPRYADDLVFGESDYMFYFLSYSIGIGCREVYFIEYGDNF
jgi:hypothetical protein